MDIDGWLFGLGHGVSLLSIHTFATCWLAGRATDNGSYANTGKGGYSRSIKGLHSVVGFCAKRRRNDIAGQGVADGVGNLGSCFQFAVRAICIIGMGSTD